MFIPPPPEHPDVHLRNERNRQQNAEREHRSGRFRGRAGGLSTGDVIILVVLGLLALGGTWFLFAWLLG